MLLIPQYGLTSITLISTCSNKVPTYCAQWESVWVGCSLFESPVRFVLVALRKPQSCSWSFTAWPRSETKQRLELTQKHDSGEGLAFFSGDSHTFPYCGPAIQAMFLITRHTHSVSKASLMRYWLHFPLLSSLLQNSLFLPEELSADSTRNSGEHSRTHRRGF